MREIPIIYLPHVPRLGIKPVTWAGILQCIGQCQPTETHWLGLHLTFKLHWKYYSKLNNIWKYYSKVTLYKCNFECFILFLVSWGGSESVFFLTVLTIVQSWTSFTHNHINVLLYNVIWEALIGSAHSRPLSYQLTTIDYPTIGGTKLS